MDENNINSPDNQEITIDEVEQFNIPILAYQESFIKENTVHTKKRKSFFGKIDEIPRKLQEYTQPIKKPKNKWRHMLDIIKFMSVLQDRRMSNYINRTLTGKNKIITPLESKKWVINPNGYIRIIADILILIVVIQTIIINPIVIGFYDELPLLIKYYNIIYYINYFILLLDIISQFCTSYSDDGDTIISYKLISQRYVTTSFIIDTISCISIIFYNSIIKYFISFLWITRIFRNNIIKKINEYMNLHMSGNVYYIIQLCKSIIYLFSIAYVTSCIWIYIGKHNQESWINNYDTDDNMLIYIIAFYWSISTLSTTGFGDVIAKNKTEYIFCSGIMIIGCCTFAYITSNMISLFNSLNKSTNMFNKKIARINEILDNCNVPKDIRKKIRTYYKICWNELNYKEIYTLDGLTINLKEQLYMNSFSGIIKKIPLIKKCK